MTERRIGAIRQKILLISTLSFFGVMLLMGSFIYLFSSWTIRNETQSILRHIAENDGDLAFEDGSSIKPEKERKSPSTPAPTYDERVEWSLEDLFGMGDIFGDLSRRGYAARYFAVLYDEQGELETVKTGNLSYIDDEKAQEYAQIALEGGKEFGNFGRYYYHVADRENGGKIVIYLDHSSQILSIRRILVAALGLLCIGTLLAFFVMRIFSLWFVRKEMDNIEKQKQFIPNASHELKTPLAVIRANTEMEEMINGENEWSQSTLRQVDRMNGLIQNLVQISRAQENESLDIREVDIAAAVRETAEPFAAVAAGEGKEMILEISDPVRILGDESRIRQITSILTDNAVKYCDENGTIRVSLLKNGKGALLTVSNDYAKGKEVDYSRFFERFYREDKARTIAQGRSDAPVKNGYGIGLSIAEDLVRSMKGSIGVNWKNGVISFTCRFN